VIPDVGGHIDSAVQVLSPCCSHQLEFEGLPHSFEGSYIMVCGSSIQTQAHVGILDQFPLCLVSQASPQSVDRHGGERPAAAYPATGESLGVRDCSLADNARPCAFVSQLSSRAGSQRDHVPYQGIYLQGAAREISSARANDIALDALLFLFNRGQCLFRNCAPLHRKPENAIAIHPTAEAVGFLAKAVKGKLKKGLLFCMPSQE